MPTKPKTKPKKKDCDCGCGGKCGKNKKGLIKVKGYKK